MWICYNRFSSITVVLTCVQLFVTSWTVAHQAPLSMGFSRWEYWNGLPFPTAGDIFDPGMKPMSLASPALTGWFFTTSATWEAQKCIYVSVCVSCSVITKPLTQNLKIIYNLFYFCKNTTVSMVEGDGNPLQYSCLENSMDRGAWKATVHGIAELDMTD